MPAKGEDELRRNPRVLALEAVADNFEAIRAEAIGLEVSDWRKWNEVEHPTVGLGEALQAFFEVEQAELDRENGQDGEVRRPYAVGSKTKQCLDVKALSFAVSVRDLIGTIRYGFKDSFEEKSDKLSIMCGSRI